MNPLATVLKSTAAVDLGWSLLHFIWQGTVLAIVCALVWHRLRHHSAQARYVVGFLCLLAMATAPVFTYASLAKRHAQSSSWVAAEFSAPASAARLDWSRPEGRHDAAASPRASMRHSGPLASEGILPWLVTFWLAGVIFFSSRLLIGWFMVQRLKRHRVGEMDPSWLEKLAELKHRAKINRAIRLCPSALVQVPTVIGWRSPVILDPASSMIGLSPS